jgi:prepilin-type N-terminal cleavage/methylation domain-containing protein
MRFHTKKTNHAPQSGFTLVEMIVAVFIFSLVMVAATAALATTINANRRAQGSQNVMTNLNFTLDAMTRAIRTGTKYCGTSACSPGDSSFSFTDTNGHILTYRLTQNDDRGTIERSDSSLNAGAFVPLTAPEVNITTLGFYESGENTYVNGDTEQPHVLVIIRGTAGETQKTAVAFDIETMITQRILDRGRIFNP